MPTSNIVDNHGHSPVPAWLTWHKQSHFSPAFLFLSTERRKAIKILYGVCRVLDDAVDVGIKGHDTEAFLKDWSSVFEDEIAVPVSKYGMAPLAESFLDVANRFKIPLHPMKDLIEKGVSQDLKKNRFQTAMDLEGYCYGVAGTVGLACLPIFGVPVEEGKNFAIRLGIAVQWINIIRDVGVDAQAGRIYLPLDHLAEFGYTDESFFELKNSDKFQQLMQYEASRARDYHRRAMELMPKGRERELLPARIMGRIYLDLLQKCEKNKFPVLDQKIRLNFWQKGMSTLKEL